MPNFPYLHYGQCIIPFIFSGGEQFTSFFYIIRRKRKRGIKELLHNKKLMHLSIIIVMIVAIIFTALIIVLNYMQTRIGLKPEQYTKRDRLNLDN